MKDAKQVGEAEGRPTIAVLGSCVSRDLFSSRLNPDWRDRYKLGPVHYQSSMLSLYGPPVEVTEESFSDLNPHDRSCVVSEMSRTFLAQLTQQQPDVLLVDFFADVRFEVIDVGGGYLTDNSWKVATSVDYARFASSPRLGLAKKEDEFLQEWTTACERLREYLEVNCPATRIVVNRARAATHLAGNKGISSFEATTIRNFNERWDLLEDIFLTIHANAVVIDPMVGGVRALDGHPWGNYWVHYEPAFYKNLDAELEATVRGRRARECSLDSIGRDLGIDQSSLGHDHLSKYEREIASLDRPIANIVIVSARDPWGTGLAFARRFPEASTTVLTLIDVEECSSPANLRVHRVAGVKGAHAVMRTLSDVDLIIEDGTHRRSEKFALFSELFLYLRDGGLYGIEDLQTLSMERFADRAGEDVLSLIIRLFRDAAGGGSRERDQREQILMSALDNLVLHPLLAIVRKRGEHWLKLTEDMDLDGCRGLLEVTEVEGGRDFTAGTEVSFNRPEFAARFRRSYHLPARRIRTYQNVVALPGQVVHSGGRFLPETFRLYRQERPHNRNVRDVDNYLALPALSAGEPELLRGDYFYLDTEYPNVYGHLVTEVVSRLWAVDQVRAMYPDLKVLVSCAEGETVLPPWFTQILAGSGFGPERIEVLERPRRVERLIGATPLFSNPVVAHPELLLTWRALRDQLLRDARREALPKKLFISRKPGSTRACHNAFELEEEFRRRGFEVVFPEDHSIPDQVALFAGAEFVAGYGGSGMLNTIFCGDKVPRLVIAPIGYNAMNEYLIASAQDSPVSYFWCDGDVPLSGGWSIDSFMSDFTFDFEADGARLREILDESDRGRLISGRAS